ncbi:MAG: hypothetical protein LBH00_05410 [Planctomycetaceae bacterium]|jgi:hypothetical protein|nr:hypothetical protein [Planctomycetaceae bacterium]
MQEREQELLLGYLMNALDRQESAGIERDLLRQPRLRSELAALQQQIAPLDYLNDPILPPPFLAEKTCAKIWAAANSTAGGTTAPEHLSKNHPSKNMGNTALNSALKPSQEFALESALIPALDPIFKPVPEPAAGKTSCPGTGTEKLAAGEIRKPRRSVPWIGLIASVSVGIILAFLAFPMIRRAGRETTNYITQTHMNAINQRVDHFEQIHVKPNPSEPAGESNIFNLATSGWQKLPPQAATDFLSEQSPYPSHDIILSAAQPSVQPVNNGGLPAAVIRGQDRPFPFEWSYPDIPLSLDTRSAGDQILITDPAIKIPLRSAYGQDILMKDGRIFFRILPGTEKSAKP